jgi:hypothetical protein
MSSNGSYYDDLCFAISMTTPVRLLFYLATLRLPSGSGFRTVPQLPDGRTAAALQTGYCGPEPNIKPQVMAFGRKHHGHAVVKVIQCRGRLGRNDCVALAGWANTFQRSHKPSIANGTVRHAYYLLWL